MRVMSLRKARPPLSGRRATRAEAGNCKQPKSGAQEDEGNPRCIYTNSKRIIISFVSFSVTIITATRRAKIKESKRRLLISPHVLTVQRYYHERNCFNHDENQKQRAKPHKVHAIEARNEDERMRREPRQSEK